MLFVIFAAMLKSVGQFMYMHVAFAATALAAFAQAVSPRPQFGDCPASRVFSGRPADPVLITPEERRFKTVIRHGMLEGIGVADGETRRELGESGANFTGHYAIVQWGMRIALLDGEWACSASTVPSRTWPQLLLSAVGVPKIARVILSPRQ